MDLKEKRRLIVFLSLLGAVVLLVVGQLGQLMILAPGQVAPPPVRFPAVERGPILDRGGKILAITTRLDSVTAWMPSLENADETAALLAQALQMDAGEIRDKLRRGTGFLYLKRKITPTESDRILELKQEGRLKGISLTPEFGRSYPEKQLGCHALGYVGVDNVGLEGIEYSLNEELSPAVVGGSAEEVYGNQVYLTLDLNIQHAAEKAALKAYRENQAESVFVLVMEARTGEILAYCAVPGFDPNEYSRFEPQALKNRIAGQAYEPGSVLKIVSIASFLDMGAIRETDTFRCTGVYERALPGGRSLRIRDVGVHGQVDAGLIIRYSCNAGAAYASEAVDAEPFYRYLRRFGFGQEVGLPFPGESAGLLAPPARWSARTKPTLAFGHEISVSALQIMAAASVFANGGQLLKPFIVRRIVSPQGKMLREFSREPVRQVVSPQVAGAMLRMMEAAVEEEDGTARRGRVAGVRISAKTGTAQVADPQTGTYSQTDFVASFLGILPSDDPDLIVYVVIHHPRGAQYYGSQVAAPVFKEVVEEILPYRGILRRGESLQRHSGEVRVRIPGPVAIGSEMPDLTGTPKRLLLPLLAEGKGRVRIRGEGYVVRQSPPAGTVIGEDSEIVLELE